MLACQIGIVHHGCGSANGLINASQNHRLHSRNVTRATDCIAQGQRAREAEIIVPQTVGVFVDLRTVLIRTRIASTRRRVDDRSLAVIEHRTSTSIDTFGIDQGGVIIWLKA